MKWIEDVERFIDSCIEDATFDIRKVKMFFSGWTNSEFRVEVNNLEVDVEFMNSKGLQEGIFLLTEPDEVLELLRLAYHFYKFDFLSFMDESSRNNIMRYLVENDLDIYYINMLNMYYKPV